jgi:hypothetical protein
MVLLREIDPSRARRPRQVVESEALNLDFRRVTMNSLEGLRRDPFLAENGVRS